MTAPTLGWVALDTGHVLTLTAIRLDGGLVVFTAVGVVPVGEHWVITGQRAYAIIGPDHDLVMAARVGLDLDAEATVKTGPATATVVFPIRMAAQPEAARAVADSPAINRLMELT